MALPDPDCVHGNFDQRAQLAAIYEALFQINTNTGGDVGSDEFTSNIENATANGSIPSGVLSWSITAVSGTVTVNGESLPVGATVAGGGYSGKVSSAAISYTVTAGSALVSYDSPA